MPRDRNAEMSLIMLTIVTGGIIGVVEVVSYAC